ncbi:MAG: LysM peptidoglycan-binding domain-containing protein [Caldilineaceae bacterium]|nr:LysM peptidoglycan-binding domain-containing protein [Caldilineaceae bacterium]
MTADSNQVPNTPEDTFVSAVERLESGEALESVLAAFPEEERADLRELLTIVAATHHLQEIDIPRPSAARRKRAKEAFLREAAGIKAAMTEAEAPGVKPALSQTVRHQEPTQTVGERLATWWAAFVAGLSPMSVRLAPLAILVIAIWLGAFSVVSVAQAAVPGDVTYPAKTWVYAQKLTLAAPKDRQQIYEAITQEVAIDTKKAEERATEEQSIRKAEIDLYVVSIGQTQLQAGEMTFDLGYQESLESSTLRQTKFVGMPVQDAQVTIEYQIVPQTVDANGNVKPSRYQAISVTVIESPVVIPTTAPEPVVDATATPAVVTGCNAAPAGWIPYVVPAGSSLSVIAASTGTGVNDLVRYNCIENANLVRAGQTIMVPSIPRPTSTPTLPPLTPTLAVILTEISTTHLTPSLTITAPVEGTPTVVVTATATTTATAAVDDATPEATVTVTGTQATATVAPTVAVTATATIVAGNTPTSTVVVPTMTPTPAVTPDGTAVATPLTTPDGTATPTPEATAPPNNTATPEVTSEATTDEATALPATTGTPAVADTPTVVSTPAPTTVGNGEGDSGEDGSGDSNEVIGASGGGSDNPTDSGPVDPQPTATEVPQPTATPVVAAPTVALPTATPTAANRSPLTGG